jgi:hypothetical protein
VGDIAQLITALAALVTATGGTVATIILALRSSGRQRVAAAEEATRLSRPPAGRHRRDNHESGADEVARSTVELGRDAVELAREARRDARFEHLEHVEPAENPAPFIPIPDTGGGMDA